MTEKKSFAWTVVALVVVALVSVPLQDALSAGERRDRPAAHPNAGAA